MCDVLFSDEKYLNDKDNVMVLVVKVSKILNIVLKQTL